MPPVPRTAKGDIAEMKKQCYASSPRGLSPLLRRVINLFVIVWSTAAMSVVFDRALSARDGKTAESLKTMDPPLDAADHQWKSGLKLVKYEVQDDRAPSGPSQSFRVTLWLKDACSKDTKVVTQYDVATNPGAGQPQDSELSP